ncbi:hypothetical protein [Anaeroselena agilis]|uniref:Uncharacterized protein n=1 Tax=Anaeroselena agilis TaxID=3063788 RepID=A0ABU3P0J0_9FIRM|nr:hypothetical protein [Selenomonadales bacterium 4137-cl]
MSGAVDVAALKREIKLEILRELDLANKPCEKICHPLRRSHWYEVHQHLSNRVQEVEQPRRRPYWMLYEAIRSVMRPAFGLQRVEHMKAESVPAAIALVDVIIEQVKGLRQLGIKSDKLGQLY